MREPGKPVAAKRKALPRKLALKPPTLKEIKVKVSEHLAAQHQENLKLGSESGFDVEESTQDCMEWFIERTTREIAEAAAKRNGHRVVE